MSNYTFRPAARSNAKPLIGLYSESGCGKTTGALMLACGFVGGDMSTVGMIETESGRGEALAEHATLGGYQVLPLREDFSPTSYGKAIKAAEDAKLRALLIDSASHEWEGSSGVLSMAAENQAAGKKGPLVWQMPKILHQREFMLRLMQTPIPLVIVCMRAKYPMKEQEIVKNGNKVKEWVRSPFLEPKQADDILFEMFIHGWIDQAHKFHGTKYTLPELRQCLEDNQPITEESGRKLAAWAAGKSTESAGTPLPANANSGARDASRDGHSDPAASPADLIDDQDESGLLDLLNGGGVELSRLLKAAGVKTLRAILKNDLQRAKDWIDRAKVKA